MALITAAMMIAESISAPAQPMFSVSDDVAAAVHDIRDDFGGEVHHESYGGFYYANDRQTVVLCCTNETKEYTELSREHPCIRLKQVNYSFNELYRLLPLAEELLVQMGLGGSSVYVSEEHNAIFVELPEGQHTLENICSIRRAAGELPLVFGARRHTAVLL